MTGVTDTVLDVSLAESRYDRQERVSWWDQRRLADARVLVVGAGALGNEIVKNLVLLGIGTIVVIDGDVIEASNLARCVFFRSADEGAPKATVLALRASELNEDVQVTGIVGDIRRMGTGIALRADVMVGAVDNREARLYCNRLAARTGRSWIDGAIEGLNGVARVFTPPSSCYECTLNEDDWRALAHRQSCRLLSREQLESGKVPTTATTSSIIAGMQAQEVIKLLHKGTEGVRVLDGGIVFDGINNDSYPIRYPNNDECLAHQWYESLSVLYLDEAGKDQMSLSQLAKAVWPEIASNSVPLVVDLNDDYVIGWLCNNCDERRSAGVPAQLVSWGESICPHCEEARIPIFITSIGIPGEHEGATVASLGIRNDEILTVRRGLEERYVWLAVPDPDLPASWVSLKVDATASLVWLEQTAR